jgi:hypothetical protein
MEGQGLGATAIAKALGIGWRAPRESTSDLRVRGGRVVWLDPRPKPPPTQGREVVTALPVAWRRCCLGLLGRGRPDLETWDCGARPLDQRAAPNGDDDEAIGKTRDRNRGGH